MSRRRYWASDSCWEPGNLLSHLPWEPLEQFWGNAPGSAGSAGAAYGCLGRFLLQASLWTACFQPAAGHPLCFLNCFLGVIGRMVSVLWAAWSQQQKQEEQGFLLVLFCIWNLKMDFHSVAVWTDSPRAQQLCSADALSLQKGLTSVAYGGKPGFGVGGGGTETWDNARYKADCGDSSIAHITLPCQGKAAIPTPKP